MRYWPFILVLAACDTPSPAFRGLDPVRVTVVGSVFDVRINGAEGEAIRLNPEYAPRMGAIGPRAIVAIEHVSGCRVSKLGGDQAMIRAKLACGKPSAAHPAPASQMGFDCDVFEQGRGSGQAEVTCRAVRP